MKSGSNLGKSGELLAGLGKKIQQQTEEKPLNLDLDKSINLEKYEGKVRGKGKRVSSVTGEEFTLGKGIVLTETANKKLNMVKAVSGNQTFNEIIDEAIHRYCDEILKSNNLEI